MPDISAADLPHVLDALDRLSKARQAISAGIIGFLKGERDSTVDTGVDREFRLAAEKLRRYHHDPHELPEGWFGCKEFAILAEADRQNKAGMSAEELARWTKDTIRAIDEHTKAVVVEMRQWRDEVQQGETIFVSLEQAAIVAGFTSKEYLRTLMNKEGSGAPTPDVEGGGGKKSLWRWSRLRPWLEKVSRRPLPKHFPSLWRP
jgi:hypothetical protein